MSVCLNVLLVEDNPGDAQMLLRLLVREGFAVGHRVVTTAAEMNKALREQSWDLVISDYTLPQFNAPAALQLLRQSNQLIPFVVVSGTMGEETAVEMIKAGANDYLMKNNLERFIPTVNREIREASRQREHRAAEDKILYQAHLIAHVHDAVFSVDLAGLVQSWNPACETLYGWQEAEIVGKPLSKYLSLEHDTSDISATTVFGLALEKGFWQGEMTQHHRNGIRMTIQCSLSVIRDLGGNAVGIVAVNTDVSERKKMIDALRSSEERYRLFFDRNLAGTAITSLSGELLDCNETYLEIFGFDSPDQAAATNLWSLFRKPDAQAFIQGLLDKGRDQPHTHIQMARKDGRPLYLLAKLVGQWDESGELTEVWNYFFDETKQHQLELELHQAQKMESLGTLAGGVAHDFNNLLGIILGYVSYMKFQLKEGETLSPSMEAIAGAAQRGADLVKQLLTFARKSDLKQEYVILADLVEELGNLLRETLPKSIVLTVNVSKEQPPIVADANQIHQVLLNLCLNARDAMPLGGDLVISVSALASEDRPLNLPKRAEGYLRLTVCDTGEGMSEQTMERIFEPFFTTKEHGRGTGLGLSVAFGIMESHGGTIEVASELGKGTEFRLYFPIAKINVPTKKNGNKAAAEDLSGTETILLVEDEVLLRKVAQGILGMKGYHVILAADGEEAVALYETHRNIIDLVISDMGLPKLTGLEVLHRIKALEPDIGFIVASGYLEPEERDRLVGDGASDVISKPYSWDEMLKSIRRTLDRKKSPRLNHL